MLLLDLARVAGWNPHGDCVSRTLTQLPRGIFVDAGLDRLLTPILYSQSPRGESAFSPPPSSVFSSTHLLHPSPYSYFPSSFQCFFSSISCRPSTIQRVFLLLLHPSFTPFPSFYSCLFLELFSFFFNLYRCLAYSPPLSASSLFLLCT